jgi:hypothetical protein
VVSLRRTATRRWRGWKNPLDRTIVFNSMPFVNVLPGIGDGEYRPRRAARQDRARQVLCSHLTVSAR